MRALLVAAWVFAFAYFSAVVAAFIAGIWVDERWVGTAVVLLFAGIPLGALLALFTDEVTA